MIEIVKVVGDRARQRRVYHDVGKAHLGLGNFDTAIDYFVRDLKIAEDLNDKVRIRTACCHLANCCRNLGDFWRAKNYIERLYKIAKEGGGESWGLFHDYQNIGTAFNTLEYPDMFILSFCYKDLLKLTEELKDTPKKGWACKVLGSSHLRMGDCETALRDCETALRFFEQHLRISKKVGDRIEEGIAYRNLGTAYQLQNEFELARIFHEACLEIAKEAGNSVWLADSFFNVGRSLESLGQLDKAAEFYKRCLSIYDDLRGRLKFEDEWKMSVRNVYQTEYASVWRLLLRQGKVIEALLSADKGRAQSLRDQLEWKYELQTNETETGTINRVSSRVFPSNTISIAIDDRDLVFWVLREGMDVEFRKKQISDNMNMLLKRESEYFVDAFLEDNDDDIKTKFYENFIAPIQDLLIGKDLKIIPEGILGLAPFAVFMDANSKYLCEFHRICVVPSLHILTVMAACPSDYHSTTGALVVGDPYMEDVEDWYFTSLPYSREEATKIAQMLSVRPLVGEEATKDKILKLMSSVALVHIASHGSSQSEILFAPSLARFSPRPREEDYRFTVKDVFGLQLRAKLVVLSTCHSAYGKISPEGVVNITRAFLCSGARSVLASLWVVDDEASIWFMTFFYEHLREGKTASEALNQAMKCMRESKKFNKERHWAPYVLIGDGDVTLKELFTS